MIGRKCRKKNIVGPNLGLFNIMLNKLVLGVGNIFILLKSIQMKLPEEIDELVLNQKLFWVFFSWFYINNIVHHNLVTFVIVVVFSLYLYKDEIAEYVESEDFSRMVVGSSMDKYVDVERIMKSRKKKNSALSAGEGISK